MPPATSLHFYRKRQTFETLAGERPQSLQSVYSVVREVLATLEERLQNLEASFYGPGGTAETEVKQWYLPLQLILRPARYSGLLSMHQLDEIYDRHIDITDILTVDEDSLVQVQTLVSKTLKAVREGFSESIIYVEKLMEFLKRYCVSFSLPEGDSYLETATNYEKQRRDLERAIKLNIENITLMADKFEKDCLGVQHFDFSMKELAERLRIDQSPIAVMFTAACHSMRNACQGLQLWIDADSNYAEYLQYDIAEMEKKKEIQARLCRDLHLKSSNNEFAVKSLKRNVDECNQQLKRLKPKELLLKTEERKLREQNKDVLVDLDIKQYRKLEMQIKGSLTDRDGIERFERLNSEILELKTRKPAIERRITDLERKQTWISERASFKNQKEAKLEQATHDLRQARRLARKAQVELERQEACLAKLKEIHLLKTTPETLKKIFHSMPLHSKYTQPSNKQKDRFEKFCRKVASEIDGDWARLYRALPFYPARGQETVASDIDDITSRFLRNTDEQAQQALSRWRRWHTRACTNDLRDALLLIRRRDILEKLERPHQEEACTVSPKIHRVVHFPKIANRARKKNHYLHF